MPFQQILESLILSLRVSLVQRLILPVHATTHQYDARSVKGGRDPESELRGITGNLTSFETFAYEPVKFPRNPPDNGPQLPSLAA